MAPDAAGGAGTCSVRRETEKRRNGAARWRRKTEREATRRKKRETASGLGRKKGESREGHAYTLDFARARGHGGQACVCHGLEVLHHHRCQHHHHCHHHRHHRRLHLPALCSRKFGLPRSLPRPGPGCWVSFFLVYFCISFSERERARLLHRNAEAERKKDAGPGFGRGK